MTLRDHLDYAIDVLLGPERIRAMLALVGVIAGTGAVIAALSIGDGARRQALDEIGALGLDTVIVRAAPPITTGEMEAIARGLTGAAVVSGVKRARSPIRIGDGSREITLLGVTSAWPDMVGLSLASGRPLAAFDDREGRRVLWVGASVARGMPPEVGAVVSVGGQPFRVAGHLQAAAGGGRISGLGIDLDETAIAPILALGDPHTLSDIVIRAHDLDATAVKRRVLGALADAGWPTARYEIVVPRELLAARMRTERGLRWLVLAIGGLALMASGVGIMNLMLATVLARTSEIGLRRAVGARARDVLWQFTCEAAVLAGVGACAGSVAGVVFSIVCGRLAGWPVAIGAGSLALGWTLAFGVTVGFAAYPAHLATRVTPARALHAE